MVEETTIRRPIVATGTFGPKERIALSFKTGGIVESVRVDAGESVQAGQVLASLHLREIDAQLNKARSMAAQAERDRERARRLHADSVVPLSQLQDAETAYEAAHADLERAELMIGFVALIGIEVKTSILLVDFTNRLREQGVELEEAIRNAGEVRFLLILLTAMTAIGGLSPLPLQGQELYAPLAWAIISGLVTATLLGRVVTPVLYKLLPPTVAAKPMVEEST